MGRMRKQTADYFPHFAYKGLTLTVLESKWGCSGYTFWFKLLELLCASDGHFYDCSKSTNMSYLAIYALCDEDTALEILNTLSEMGKIDAPLWNEKKIIWCQSLVDRLTALYSKRTTSVPKKPLLDGGRSEPTEEPPQREVPAPTPSPTPNRRGRPSGSKKKTLTAEQQALFERFYSAYPKKVDRATAERAWAKIDPQPDAEMTDKIIAAVEAAKANDSRFRERQYTPNPASWLNAQGYLNEYGGGGADGRASENFRDTPDSFRPSGGFRNT